MQFEYTYTWTEGEEQKSEVFTSSYVVRQAIWEHDKKVFGEEPVRDEEAEDPAALRTEFWAALNVAYKEIPDPEPTEEEKKAAALEEAKRIRAEAVAAIKVAVDGMVFDGDEISQTRMSNALRASETAGLDSTVWVLADNTVATVTKEQLAKALTLAMQEMAKVWTLPYTGGDAAE